MLTYLQQTSIKHIYNEVIIIISFLFSFRRSPAVYSSVQNATNECNWNNRKILNISHDHKDGGGSFGGHNASFWGVSHLYGFLFLMRCQLEAIMMNMPPTPLPETEKLWCSLIMDSLE